MRSGCASSAPHPLPNSSHLIRAIDPHALKIPAPKVDGVVARLVERQGDAVGLDREAKRALLEPLTGRFSDSEETRTLFDWTARTAFSLASVIDGSATRLEIPELRHA